MVGAFTRLSLARDSASVEQRAHDSKDELPLPRISPGLGTAHWPVTVFSLQPWARGSSSAAAFFLADDRYSAWFQAISSRTGGGCVKSPQVVQMDHAPDAHVHLDSQGVYLAPRLSPHSFARSLGLHRPAHRRLGRPDHRGRLHRAGRGDRRNMTSDRPDRAGSQRLASSPCSTTFLFNSMTMWSMPTHLLVDLVWIWLYVENRRKWSKNLPWSASSRSASQPHTARCSSSPFLAYLRQRRWGVLLLPRPHLRRSPASSG